MAKKIGEILLKAELISNDQLHQALQEQKRTGERLGSLLVKMGFLAEDEILSCLSKQFGVPAIDLETFQIEFSVLETDLADAVREVVNGSEPMLIVRSSHYRYEIPFNGINIRIETVNGTDGTVLYTNPNKEFSSSGYVKFVRKDRA